MKICTLCNKPAILRGWCSVHYSRWLRLGDPLHPVRQRNNLDGETKGGMTAEYLTWVGMKQRCLNPRNGMYYRYGGRGITICQRWLDSYLNFLADMGRKPSPKHSIDRIDNDGNYEPGNCRWATRLEQGRNQSQPNKLMTHCKRGHEFSERNTYITAAGGRQCRECVNLSHRKSYYIAHPRKPHTPS